MSVVRSRFLPLHNNVLLVSFLTWSRTLFDLASRPSFAAESFIDTRCGWLKNSLKTSGSTRTISRDALCCMCFWRLVCILGEMENVAGGRMVNHCLSPLQVRDAGEALRSCGRSPKQSLLRRQPQVDYSLWGLVLRFWYGPIPYPYLIRGLCTLW